MPSKRESPSDGTDRPAPTADERDRYPMLGTQGLRMSSSSQADISVRTSKLEGWVVASVLLLASALAMGIYLVVLHR